MKPYLHKTWRKAVYEVILVDGLLYEGGRTIPAIRMAAARIIFGDDRVKRSFAGEWQLHSESPFLTDPECYYYAEAETRPDRDPDPGAN